MREEMQMTRLTITFDDGLVNELDQLPLAELQGALLARLDSSGTTAEQAASWIRLSHSLDELGEDPSASAVVRQALGFFLAALRDAQRDARLEAGYAVLAADREREQMIKATSRRTPERVADEP
jgi:metal-responsive CopG/Arc/MetJ family transcriptional regulator